MLFYTSNKKKKKKKKKKKEAGRAIKVAVLEGGYASLCALGLPLSLSIQLQQSCLKLCEAQWTARSSAGGFSVSLFWPSAPEKVKNVATFKKKKRRRKRGKARVQAAQPTTPSPPEQCTSHESTKLNTSKTVAPNKALQTDGSSPSHMSLSYERGSSSHVSPSNVLPSYEKGEDHQTVKSTSPSHSKEWTKVTRKRRSRLPPCWKLKVPVHLRDTLKTPSTSGTSSDSESTDFEQSDDKHLEHDTAEGSHHQSTPVAARTRSRLKHYRFS